ncbi:YidC/Oxa1 family membrane protein insertase [Amycolatopsis nigrescens]|uniref:YidC/Oxa1 family membrane protein insertase n=1 Tax=Amycolatopsis nigrescens TaxID=381445 RepID=UPI0003668B83|nr:membrane protein insertase YidC [Amycolatopsis nigrescens]
MFGFLDLPVSAAYHLVTWLAHPLGVAIAIVAFTACVRLLLLPLAKAAVRGEKARAVLMPEIQKLRDKYGNNQQRLHQEVTKLQKESGTSMFVGCLPMFAQVPFFMVMYRLFSTTTIGDRPNALLDDTLFGTPLGAHWFPVAAGHTPVFIGLFVLLAVVGWCSARWQAKQSAGNPAVPGAALLRLMPYFTVVAAAFIPLAAGLYLLTTTTWTVAERAILRRERKPVETR